MRVGEKGLGRFFLSLLFPIVSLIIRQELKMLGIDSQSRFFVLSRAGCLYSMDAKALDYAPTPVMRAKLRSSAKLLRLKKEEVNKRVLYRPDYQ